MNDKEANDIYGKHFPKGSKATHYDPSKEPGHIRRAGDKQKDKANALCEKLRNRELNDEERQEIQNAIKALRETADYKNLID